jgi:putative aldouronate transport system substrate-binding protein
MNEKGAMSGVEAVNMLRTYIDETYGGYYGTKRSDLFIGQNAAWDADELVALLRCVVANAYTLNGTDTVYGLFSREDNNNQRKVDLFRFAGHLFGVRGLESRQDYLYVGTDGELHDARQEADTYEALARMNAMAKEGLISKAFLNNEEVNSGNYLENDLGFMSYDYNQTQTIMNGTKLHEGEKYMAAMVPVACWQDGTEGGKYMRFTESWRSVKTDGWGISKAGVEGDEGKLKAALALIDYAYSEKGQILMSYGPDAFIKTKDDGSYETFLFNGKEMPVIADATAEELQTLAKGNYTNFARKWLGSTLSFVKSQAFEYQCTHPVGKEGAGKISVAIGLGTIKHPELALAENPWYTSVPTVLPNTKVENDELNTYTELTPKGKFNQGKGGENVFVDLIINGFGAEGFGGAEEAVKTVSDSWHGFEYLMLKQDAWKRLQDYYATLK